MKTSKLIALTVSGAIALTAAATPASAASDRDRVAQLLFGAAAIGVIAHVIHKDKKKRRHQAVTHNHHYKVKPAHRHHKYRKHVRKHRSGHGQGYRHQVRNNHGHHTNQNRR